MLLHRSLAAGKEARPHAVSLLAEPEIEARGLELPVFERGGATDQFTPRHRLDLAASKQAERRVEESGFHGARFARFLKMRQRRTARLGHVRLEARRARPVRARPSQMRQGFC